MPSSLSEFDANKVVFDQTHVLFHRACGQYAERIAIEHGEQHITYEGLLNRVNSIRALLLAHHLDQGKIVAVYGERSVDVIACSIAVWTIGSILMLIESSMPEHRRNLMLKSVATNAVVLCGVDCVVDDMPTIDLRLAQQPSTDFKFENHTGDHAYIAFTSGSTGQPKAIVGSHNGLSQFLTWQSKDFSIAPGERFAHFTKLDFLSAALISQLGTRP
jgi:non-ribosomal peptide synthetase component F